MSQSLVVVCIRRFYSTENPALQSQLQVRRGRGGVVMGSDIYAYDGRHSFCLSGVAGVTEHHLCSDEWRREVGRGWRY